MASDGESVGCFARLFGGGGDKKSITVDMSKNSEVSRREHKAPVQSILAKTSGVSIRQTLHFSSIATHVSNNGGQPVHILLTGVTASIQCAPAPAAGVAHVPVVVEAPEAPAVVAEERVAVDVHQEEIHHEEVEPATVEVEEPAAPECDVSVGVDEVADAAGDVEVCQEGVQVVPDEPVLEEGVVPEVPEGGSVEIPSEDAPDAEFEGQQQAVFVADEEIVVCEDNQEVFSEPPMSLEEDVIQVEEVVAVEQEPEMVLTEDGEASVAAEGEVVESAEVVAEGEPAAEPEKKKKKKKTSEAEDGGEVTEKKKKKKKSEVEGEGGEVTEKKKKKKKSEAEDGGEGGEGTEKKKKKKKKSEADVETPSEDAPVDLDTTLEVVSEEVDNTSTAVVVEEECCEEPLENEAVSEAAAAVSEVSAEKVTVEADDAPTAVEAEAVVEADAVVEAEAAVETETVVETTETVVEAETVAEAETVVEAEAVENGTIPITGAAESLKEDLAKEDKWSDDDEEESSEDEIDPFFLPKKNPSLGR